MSFGTRANLLFQEVGVIESELGGLGKGKTIKIRKLCAFVVSLQQVETPKPERYPQIRPGRTFWQFRMSFDGRIINCL
jgi:hypothetical protein